MNIKDIAKICGVSPSTVSKIINDKDEDISLETRKKVLSIIKEYQFVPYSKILKNAMPKSNIIGVMISEQIEGIETVIYEIERKASQNGYSIILCNTEGILEKAEKYLHILESRGVDGIILMEQDESIIGRIKTPSIVLRSTNVKSKNSKVADIYYEKQDIGYLATQYLLEKGHNRIGTILWEQDEAVTNGYVKAYQEYNIAHNLMYHYKGKNIEEIEQVLISECLDTDITAIICSNPQMAQLIYKETQKRGDRVPRDISVISIRDEKTASILIPELTTARITAEVIAENAIQALVGILEERISIHDSCKKIHPEICERSSVMPPAKNKQGGKIIIVGSMNMDCVISVPKIPTDGETVISNNIIELPGGKGANQAVGAGKLDGLVYMIGRLGDDSEGKRIYNNLVNVGVKMDGVAFDSSMPTGKAYVNVSPNGESTIVVYKGANENLDGVQISRHKKIFKNAKYCLISLEIDEEAAECAVKECKKNGVKVILKPSAVEKVNESLYPMIDYFIPNEKELNQLIPGEMTIEAKADILLKKGVKNIIITLGKKGCYLKNAEVSEVFQSAKFVPVDTTGAADAFISALAVFLSEGYDIIYAIWFATYAAGISITRYGVQAALTDRSGLDIYKDEIHAHIK